MPVLHAQLPLLQVCPVGHVTVAQASLLPPMPLIAPPTEEPPTEEPPDAETKPPAPPLLIGPVPAEAGEPLDPALAGAPLVPMMGALPLLPPEPVGRVPLPLLPPLAAGLPAPELQATNQSSITADMIPGQCFHQD